MCDDCDAVKEHYLRDHEKESTDGIPGTKLELCI